MSEQAEPQGSETDANGQAQGPISEQPSPDFETLRTTQGHVEELRRRLLDLRTSNRLLHFPHAARGRNYVRAVDEVPEILHAKLLDGRTLRILALPEPPLEIDEEESSDLPAVEEAARFAGIDPSYALPALQTAGERSHDDALQTLLYPELHQKVLGNIADVTRSAQEEQGIHTLFAAFGFIEWYERAEAESARFAPLVLLPLSLSRERKLAVHEYAVSALDEEHEVNLAFSERLFRDFGFRLPAWSDEDDLGSYFVRVDELVRTQPRWKFHRWVTLSNFSFARIAMYHDLDMERWPAGQAPHEHPTFRSLTSCREPEPVARFAEEHAELPALADAHPSLVLDADTSQIAAILEAMEPRNLVIKGPPGTGKSQTIANLIAAALHEGQRVLFVAEKMAALDVVKARLDAAGLGHFCLELHAQRATKRAVMESLATRLELRTPPPTRRDAERKRAETLRAGLNGYAAALQAPMGALGHSVHLLIWLRERARRAVEPLLGPLEKLRIDGAASIRQEELDVHRHALRGLAQAATDRERVCDGSGPSVWLRLERSGLDEQQLLTQVERYQAALQGLHEARARALGERFELQVRRADLSVLCELARALPAELALRPSLLQALGVEAARAACERAITLLSKREALELALGRSCQAPRAVLSELEAIEQASTRLEQIGAQERLVDARARALAQRSACDELTKGLESSTRWLALMGVDSLDEPEAAILVRAALQHLNELPREQLRALRAAPALLEEGALDSVRALAQQAEGIRAAQAKVEEHVAPEAHELELSQHAFGYALALRRPWLFAWLFAAFWSARRLYGRMARKTVRTRDQMAEDLLSAARVLEARRLFAARQDARALCGAAFQGVDTDFALLERATSWAERVRREFALLHRAAAGLRQFLLQKPLEDVDIVQAESQRTPLAPLWLVAERARDEGRVPSELIAEDRSAAVDLLGALDVLASATLRAQLTRAELTAALAEFDALAGVEARLPRMRAELARLGVSDDLERLPLAELKQAFELSQAAALHALSPVLLATIAEPKERAKIVQELAPALAREATLRAPLSSSGLDDGVWDELQKPIVEALGSVARALATRPLLRAQLRYLRERERASATFAGPVVAALADGSVPPDKLVDATEFLLYDELVQQACEQSPALGELSGTAIESMRTHYRKLDRELLKLNAQKLAFDLERAPVPEGVAAGKKSEWSELALITHELSKKQRHLPLRQLLARTSGALRKLKPCFMMSPLTVAQYLPQEADQFDLVVIDEASQLRPEDAMGCLVRAKRAVVVGDPKQLPPTTFFQRLEGALDADTENDLDGDEPIDAESILDLGVASFGAPRDLRWHYRSRHPSLIAFSNEHFYDGRLKVFPAPHSVQAELGVQLVEVDGEYAASLNEREAEEVALAVQEHVHARTKRSLGVVAMNQKQKALIEQKLSELDDEAVRDFVESSSASAPFFVKSLENVQGDERDVIFVSLTYGPDPQNKRVLQRFGPLNGRFGARRLNVLFTRARERLLVFSSLKPEDLTVDEHASAGLQTLRKYLVYAQSGQLPAALGNLSASEDPFEVAVHETLTAAGYTVVPRVGVQGFFVDLGVKALDGTRFACGVECDGPGYHTQRSTRDRERLREEVLEAQGWQIVRVWSTDWYRSPEAARHRLLQQVALQLGAAPMPRARVRSA